MSPSMFMWSHISLTPVFSPPVLRRVLPKA